ATLAAGLTRRQRLATALERLDERGTDLFKLLWNGLAEIAGVQLYGPTPDKPRTPTLSFTIEKIASTRVAQELAKRGIFVSHGDFYAATIVERLGLTGEGLVRAGCACYTT